MGFTPHSARAGWATEQRLKGVPFAEIKAQGRWAADKSLLTYLDVASATALELQLGQLGLQGDWILGDIARRFPWWPR